MINIFTPVQNDQSIYYLGQIFGVVGSVLPVSGYVPLVLGTMFKVFNTVVLSFGALVILYVTVMGVIKTAHEGEFLGKHWNSFWVPIRMVLGIAMLVPSSSGYCTIQMVVMWIVLQGVGAADTLWTTTLNYAGLTGSIVSQVQLITVNTQPNMETLFQGLTCQATMKINSNVTSRPLPDIGGGPYFCYQNTTSPFCTLDNKQILRLDPPQTIPGLDSNKNPALIYSMGPSGACGALTFCDPDPNRTGAPCNANQSDNTNLLNCTVCKAQKQALQDTVSVLGAIGNQFAQIDLSVRQFMNEIGQPTSDPVMLKYCASLQNVSKNQCCQADNSSSSTATSPLASAVPGPACLVLLQNTSDTDADFTSPSNAVDSLYWPAIQASLPSGLDFISTVGDNYNASLDSAIAAAISTMVQQPSGTTALLQSVQSLGWIFAGGLYYKLSQANNSNLKAANPYFNVETSTSSISSNRNNYAAADELLNQMKKAATNANPNANGIGSGSPSFGFDFPAKFSSLSKVMDAGNNSGQNIMNSLMKMLTNPSGGNPLLQLQTVGEVLIIVAEAFLAVVLVVMFAIALVGGTASMTMLGIGNYTGINNGIFVFMTLLTPLITILIVGCFTFGAMLAVYVPLIPYIIFTMGAIAWFLLIIEAMVAAPLVALGILSPGGEHELLGKSAPALMLLFNIFLRPSLMIFGMVAAMLLAVVVVTMINAGFSSVMITINKSPGPVELFFFLAAYVGIILSALNKCFALIHIVPDRTLRWIGAQGGEEGAGATSEAMQKAEGQVGAVAGKGSEVGRGTGGKAEGMVKGGAEQRAKAAEQLRRDVAKGKGPSVSAKTTPPPT